MMSLPIKPRINCKDGVSLSVQADEHKYCLPRHDEGPHHAVEVGYICDAEGESMSPPESWAPYADGMFPSDVYGYVPTELVEEFIESHGGRK
jgi:hypothetical protein